MDKADELMKSNKQFIQEKIKIARKNQRDRSMKHELGPARLKRLIGDHFDSRWSKVYASFFMFVVLLLIGAAFYAWYEPCACSYGVTRVAGCEDDRCVETGGLIKTPLDACAMSVETLTTVGFGNLSPQTRLGRAFAIVWMFAGSVACGIFVNEFAQVVLTGRTA